jgi:hypothetical protein
MKEHRLGTEPPEMPFPSDSGRILQQFLLLVKFFKNEIYFGN